MAWMIEHSNAQGGYQRFCVLTKDHAESWTSEGAHVQPLYALPAPHAGGTPRTDALDAELTAELDALKPRDSRGPETWELYRIAETFMKKYGHLCSELESELAARRANRG